MSVYYYISFGLIALLYSCDDASSGKKLRLEEVSKGEVTKSSRFSLFFKRIDLLKDKRPSIDYGLFDRLSFSGDLSKKDVFLALPHTVTFFSGSDASSARGVRIAGIFFQDNPSQENWAVNFGGHDLEFHEFVSTTVAEEKILLEGIGVFGDLIAFFPNEGLKNESLENELLVLKIEDGTNALEIDLGERGREFFSYLVGNNSIIGPVFLKGDDLEYKSF